MKHIKVFEKYFDNQEKIDNIKVGDYILADYTYEENPKWTEYIRNSAGKVVDIVASTYDVKYIINDFAYNTLINSDKRFIKKDDDGSKYINLNIRKREIRNTAPTAIELEMKISINKYNL